MNILYINHYAGSIEHGMEFRPYYLSKEWVAAGHRVTIVASSYSHVRARQPHLGGASKKTEIIDGVEYIWFGGPGYAGNGTGRVRNMLSFLYRLHREGKFLAATVKPDIVIASSTYPMDIWPARRIARLAGSRLVFEVHDLWPLSPMELGGMSKWHPFILWVQQAEDYAYRHADAVVSILPHVHEYMASRGLDLSKLRLVPNGIDPTEWERKPANLPAPVLDRLTAIRQGSRAIVGYAGSHGLANALDYMLRSVSALQDGSVAFVLFGSGPEKESLVQLASSLGLNNVHFFEPIEKCHIPELLTWFDVAYIGWQPHPLYRFGISPNKLFDYMMAARAVLHVVDVPADPVQLSGCGISVRSENIHDTVDALKQLLALSVEQRSQLGQLGQRFVLANHIYPVLARMFLDAARPASAA